MGGRYATRRVVLTPGAESAATGVSLTALTERVHPARAIPPGRNYSLLMYEHWWGQPGCLGCLHGAFGQMIILLMTRWEIFVKSANTLAIFYLMSLPITFQPGLSVRRYTGLFDSSWEVFPHNACAFVHWNILIGPNCSTVTTRKQCNGDATVGHHNCATFG